MPTLQLWSLLRHEPVSVELRKLLHLEQKEQGARLWKVLAAIGLVVFMPFMLLLAIPVFVNFLCLQKTMQIAATIDKQYRTGRHDVLAVTPLGDMGLLLQVARIYFSSFTTSLIGFVRVWGVASAGAGLLFLVLGANLTEIVQGAMSISLLVVALFTDYVQSVIWATLVGVFAGITNQDTKARFAAFAGYFGFQIIFYAGITLVLLMTIFSISARTTLIEMIFLFVVPFLLCFAIREGAIAIVWKLIRERINDDVPALNVKLKRG